MPDVFDGIFPEPPDPTEAAQRAVRPRLRQRFYQGAAVDQGEGGTVVVLDGRPVRTPGRHLLAAPVRSLAELIAQEWDAQRDFVEPARMPLTRLANTIIDGVARAPEAVAEEVGKYLGSDLLFYRAQAPEGLAARQGQYWDPVLEWAREALGARFMLSQGVMFVAQPERAVAAASSAIPRPRGIFGAAVSPEAWRLGAVHSITTLTGSALLALALLRNRLTAEEAWAAAHVDEDWQMQHWGEDPLALERRGFRWSEMQAAGAVLRLIR
jgi:chaperone required for assembly of F1-ATPase